MIEYLTYEVPRWFAALGAVIFFMLGRVSKADRK